jgi:xylulokinase
MALVARVVASAPSTTVTLVDLDAGALVREATVTHDRHDPDSWWVGLQRAFAEVAEPEVDIASISVAASPGVVVLDADRRPLWVAHPGDVVAGPDAGWLAEQLDGADAWTAAIGRAPTGDDAISALSWLHRSEPGVWDRLAVVASPLAVLLERLTGRLVTSADDAASTGYWSPAGRAYRLDLLAIVDRERDWSGALPDVVATGDEVGTWQGSPVVVG